MRKVIRASGYNVKTIAEKIGAKPNTLHVQFTRNDISYQKLADIVDALGGDIIIKSASGARDSGRFGAVGGEILTSKNGYTFDSRKCEAIICTPKIAGARMELFCDRKVSRYYIVVWAEWFTFGADVVEVTPAQALEFYKDCGGRDEQYDIPEAFADAADADELLVEAAEAEDTDKMDE